LATEPVLSVLKAGGNAVEAASAIVAMIGVVYPHFCGLGAGTPCGSSPTAAAPGLFSCIGQAAGDLQGFPDGSVRAMAGRLRMAQHGQTQAVIRPRGRATRPTRGLVFVCKLGG
jgi:Gamma-glutamyltranspeptidase